MGPECFVVDALSSHIGKRLTNDGDEFDLFLVDVSNIILDSDFNSIALMDMIHWNFVDTEHNGIFLLKYL